MPIISATPKKRRYPFWLYLPNGEVLLKHYYSWRQARGHYIQLCIAKSIHFTEQNIVIIPSTEVIT